MVIYVGDARDVIKRIRGNHCSGNVESSALRKHIAVAKGYGLKASVRSNGSRRLRIDLSDPRAGEREVSSYIRSGEWRVIFCDSYEEAHDFQWYVIERTKPLLNVESKVWERNRVKRYETLLAQLEATPTLSFENLKGLRSGPGVYVLYHEALP